MQGMSILLDEVLPRSQPRKNFSDRSQMETNGLSGPALCLSKFEPHMHPIPHLEHLPLQLEPYSPANFKCPQPAQPQQGIAASHFAEVFVSQQQTIQPQASQQLETNIPFQASISPLGITTFDDLRSASTCSQWMQQGSSVSVSELSVQASMQSAGRSELQNEAAISSSLHFELDALHASVTSTPTTSTLTPSESPTFWTIGSDDVDRFSLLDASSGPPLRSQGFLRSRRASSASIHLRNPKKGRARVFRPCSFCKAENHIRYGL
jgi:hypothetical protein